MAKGEIAFWVSLAFLLGVTLAGFSVLGTLVIFGVLFLILISRFIFEIKAVICVGIGIAIFCGFFYYFIFFAIRNANSIIPLDQPHEFVGTVVRDPAQGDKFETLRVGLQQPFHGTINVFVLSGRQFAYGDEIKFTGTILPSRNEREVPAAFPQNVIRVSERNGFLLIHVLHDIRDQIFGTFAAVLPSDQSALLSGLTLGSRANFTSELRDAMKNSGTIHLVALSGYNIMIIVGALWLFLKGRVHRRIAFSILILSIIFFVMMVGAEPSIVRAAIMAFLALFAREIGRVSHMRNAIAITALIMVLLDPGVLFSLSFILSFLSLIGIVYLSPKIIQKRKDLGQFIEVLVLTVSAQIMVAPLLIATFGSVSLTAILANLMILPFAPLVMFLGFMIGFGGFLTHGIAWILAKPASLFLGYMISVMQFFGKARIPISFGEHSVIALVLAYSIILGVLLYRNDQKR